MPKIPKTKVLLVEDDKFLSKLITTKLEKEGYRVESAIDGESGIKKLADFKPDVILLDILLPGIDGFEVLKRFKSSALGVKSVPVIMLSNLGEDEYISKGISMGAVDYLIKSNFTTDEIIQKITQVIGST